MSARTVPHAAPATTGSPTRSVPRSTRTVATGPAADVEVGLEHDAPGRPFGVGHDRRVLEVGHQEDLLEQVVDAEVLQRGDLDGDRVAAPRLGLQPLLGELLQHAGRVGVVAVDLVDGDHDGHVGGAWRG